MNSFTRENKTLWKQKLEETKGKISDESLYKGRPIPKKGDPPSDFSALLGSDEYYLARRRDFELRHPGENAPKYYEEYGNKYLHKFKYDTKYSLSSEGQKWLTQTLENLQKSMEYEIQRSNGEIENDSNIFQDFAYRTHPAAYIDAGLFDLPISDLIIIGTTPDFADLLTPSGLEQIIKVGQEFIKQRVLSK